MRQLHPHSSHPHNTELQCTHSRGGWTLPCNQNVAQALFLLPTAMTTEFDFLLRRVQMLSLPFLATKIIAQDISPTLLSSMWAFGAPPFAWISLALH